MNCERVQEILPELPDRRLDETAHPEVRAHLAHCPACQREFAALTQVVSALDTSTPVPSARMRANFQAFLAEEKRSAAGAQAAIPGEEPALRRRSGGGWRWVLSPALATAFLLGGFLLGSRYSPAPSPAPAAPDDSTKRELAALRSEFSKMTQLVGYSLLQQQQGPINDRLRDVLLAANTETPSEKVLDQLISALAFDPSHLVRLRALEALSAHADNAVVRSGILAALPREQNALVQLELIEFFATARDREAAPVLENMAQNATIDQSVRAAAQRALAQL